jgi:hypothetical protein
VARGSKKDLFVLPGSDNCHNVKLYRSGKNLSVVVVCVVASQLGPARSGKYPQLSPCLGEVLHGKALGRILQEALDKPGLPAPRRFNPGRAVEILKNSPGRLNGLEQCLSGHKTPVVFKYIRTGILRAIGGYSASSVLILDTLIGRVKMAAPEFLEVNRQPHTGIRLLFKMERQAIIA